MQGSSVLWVENMPKTVVLNHLMFLTYMVLCILQSGLFCPKDIAPEVIVEKQVFKPKRCVLSSKRRVFVPKKNLTNKPCLFSVYFYEL